MALNEEIVQKIDSTKKVIQRVYENLDPENYVKFYDQIWTARAEIEYIVISLKLLNNLENRIGNEKWKEEITNSLKQVRSEQKIREVFEEILELFNKLEGIKDILEFYKICWILKEKITVLLNVVKPKIKLMKKENNSK